MKLGKTVAVCHDGKYSRRIQGTIIATNKGSKILVRFPHPDPEVGGDVQAWFRKEKAIRHWKKLDNIWYGKRPARFSGWVDVDWFCPWFTVYPWKD